MAEAKAAFAEAIVEDGDAETAIKNLSVWKRSKEWAKDGGQYVPYLCNWLKRGTWKSAPELPFHQGGVFKLGDAEKENIRRIMEESGDGNG